jgi:prepilin-type processing-associated H-X9-DG protein
MAIVFNCECGRQLQVRDEHAGRRVKCPECGEEMTAPSAAAIQSEANAPYSAPQPERRARRFEDDESEREVRGPRSRSGKAVAALVLGFLSFCLWLFAAVPAIILGILSLREISRSNGRLKGQGMAIGGLVTAGLAIVLFPLVLIPIGLLVPAVQKVRSASVRVQDSNNLKQISLAMIMYSDTHRRMPPSVVYDANGRPLYSWRVLILPHLEQNHLYQQFHLDEPWDSPHNKTLLAQMPKVYAAPGETYPPKDFATYYQVFDGPGATFNSGVREKRQRPSLDGLQPFRLAPPGMKLYESKQVANFPATFTDGTSNTILIVEAAIPVPWTKPDDLPFDPIGPLPALGGIFNGDANVAYADGSVRFIPKKALANERNLRAAITPNGGEVPDPNWP